MSREGVEQIIERALVDERFRAALFADPRQVGRRFDVTPGELARLMGEVAPPQSSEKSSPESSPDAGADVG